MSGSTTNTLTITPPQSPRGFAAKVPPPTPKKGETSLDHRTRWEAREAKANSNTR